MKKLLFALSLSLAVFLPRAQAVADSLPYLSSIRSEVLDQLTIASNNVAATNDVAVNKKLIKTLLGAVKTIDKTKTNFVAGAKSLATLNKSLSRTVVSNEFNPLIDQTFDVYVGSLYAVREVLADRVNSSYPGKSQTAALAGLAKLLAAIDSASTNTNFLVALKFLSAAAKAEVAAQKATVKAEAAPAPPNGFSATVTASHEGTFAYKPILQSVQGVYDNVLDRMIITTQELNVSGGANNLLTQARNIYFTLINIPGSGTYTYDLTGPGLLAFYSSTRTRTTGALSGNPQTTVEYAETYNVNDVDPGDINQGTLTITFDTTTKLAYGTFSFTANGDDVPSRTATVNGSFSITTLP